MGLVFKNKHFKTGKRFITNGGWNAVICWEDVGTVFHEVNGGVLYTHNVNNGTVRSREVGPEYDLRYVLIELE